jgi:Flp pilus assembly protein TadD
VRRRGWPSPTPQAAELDPADPDAWTLAGVALLARRDYGSALDALRRAIAITPAAHRARHHLALAQLALGSADAARATWTHLLEAEPGHPCRTDLAVLELAQGRLERARELLEAAPAGPRRDHYLAVARHRLGDAAALALLREQADGGGPLAGRSRSYLASLPAAEAGP